ncbi:MAG TPA: hypothetical protein VET23_03860 [Chitinophagaceae bacterium]|nr:hypothetical protein [Chitinophagaceae bacterium]
MKKILFVTASFIFISVHAQTVDEIIQKYNTTLGGLDAFKAIKSAKITGNVSVQGNDLPLTVQIINGRAVRSDVEFMGQSITNSFKDGKGWKVNPLAGVNTPTDVDGTELADLKSQSSMASPLMDYKDHGNQVELEGQEDVEGIKTYKIKLTNKDDGKVTTYFISTTDNTLIKSVGSREIQGQELEIETFYSDIKDFNGLKFAMTRTQKIEGQVFQEVKYTSIEFNVPIVEKVFDKPE